MYTACECLDMYNVLCNSKMYNYILHVRFIEAYLNGIIDIDLPGSNFYIQSK